MTKHSINSDLEKTVAKASYMIDSQAEKESTKASYIANLAKQNLNQMILLCETIPPSDEDLKNIYAKTRAAVEDLYRASTVELFGSNGVIPGIMLSPESKNVVLAFGLIEEPEFHKDSYVLTKTGYDLVNSLKKIEGKK